MGADCRIFLCLSYSQSYSNSSAININNCMYTYVCIKLCSWHQNKHLICFNTLWWITLGTHSLCIECHDQISMDECTRTYVCMPQCNVTKFHDTKINNGIEMQLEFVSTQCVAIIYYEFQIVGTERLIKRHCIYAHIN